MGRRRGMRVVWAAFLLLAFFFSDIPCAAAQANVSYFDQNSSYPFSSEDELISYRNYDYQAEINRWCSVVPVGCLMWLPGNSTCMYELDAIKPEDNAFLLTAYTDFVIVLRTSSESTPLVIFQSQDSKNNTSFVGTFVGCGPGPHLSGTLHGLLYYGTGKTIVRLLGIHISGAFRATDFSLVQKIIVWGLKVENCTDSYNNTGSTTIPDVSEFGSGLLFNQGVESVYVMSSEFTGNVGKYGPAIASVRNGCKIRVENCTFSDNSAGSLGGAVYSQGRPFLLIDGSRFERNSAKAGGAVMVEIGEGIFITNSIFEQNRARGINTDFTALSEEPLVGGGVFSKGAAYIDRSQFLNNSATQTAGALVAIKNLIVRDSTFFGNYVSSPQKNGFSSDLYQMGGALRSFMEANITDSLFVENMASYLGAVSCAMDLWIENCTFLRNYANGSDDSAGGAVGTDANMTILRSLFESNWANLQGGALYATGNINLFDTIFINNTAGLNGDGGGGAVLSGGNIRAKNCTVQKNFAPIGGGFFSMSNAAFEGCLFAENSATSLDAGKGMAGAVITLGNLTVTKSVFDSNNCTMRGGALLSGGFVNITDTEFYNNSIIITNEAPTSAGPSEYGGAAVFSNKGVFVQNCTFADNFCAVGFMDEGQYTCAGGIETSPQAIMTIGKSRFIRNRSSGLGGAVAADILFLSNSYFSSNYGQLGGAVYANTVTAHNCSFQDNRAFSLGGALYVQQSMSLDANNTFYCNAASENGGGLFYFSARSAYIDPTTTFTNNISPVGTCSEYALSNGRVCQATINMEPCKCDWSSSPQGIGCDPETARCVPNADPTQPAAYANESVYNVPVYGINSNGQWVTKNQSLPAVNLGFRCVCKGTGAWKDPTARKCYPCSTCGADGTVIKECAPTSDTFCRCPLGYTGHNCTMPCPLGPNCTALDEDMGCPFSHLGNVPGRCRTCISGAYINSTSGQCVPCSSCGLNGIQVANCSGSTDTVCQCPLGFTGDQCLSRCQMPTGCVQKLPGCSFSPTDYTLGALCMECTSGYYLQPVNTAQYTPSNPFYSSVETRGATGVCVPWTVCGQDEIELSAPNKTSDRVCCGGKTGVLCPNDPVLTPVQIAGIVIGVTAALLMIVVVTWKLANRIAKKRAERKLDVELMKRNIRKNHQWVDAGTEEAHKCLSAMRAMEGQIARSQFVVLETLGQGQFGTVSKGVVFVEHRAVECAIKTSRESDVQMGKEFLREAEIMKRLDHPNIVKIIGVCTEKSGGTNMPTGAKANRPSVIPSLSDLTGRRNSAAIVVRGGTGTCPHGNPLGESNGCCSGAFSQEFQGLSKLYLVIEYMDMGDLHTMLFGRGTSLSIDTKLFIVWQLAEALAYLGTLVPEIIHRDIAARNVLLSTRGSNTTGYPTVKLSDMGLARLAQDAEYVKVSNQGARLPCRWMAPESLKENTYTHKTDCWSFGVTVWEVFSNGALPYGSLFGRDAPDFIHSLVTALVSHNVRLLQPPGCPSDLFNEVMYPCWLIDPGQRPTGRQLAQNVHAIFRRHGGSVRMGTQSASMDVLMTRSSAGNINVNNNVNSLTTTGSAASFNRLNAPSSIAEGYLVMVDERTRYLPAIQSNKSLLPSGSMLLVDGGGGQNIEEEGEGGELRENGEERRYDHMVAVGNECLMEEEEGEGEGMGVGMGEGGKIGNEEGEEKGTELVEVVHENEKKEGGKEGCSSRETKGLE